MRFRHTKKLFLIVACAALLQSAAGIANASADQQASPVQTLQPVKPQTPEEKKRLSDQVQTWMDELSKQQPFAAWSGADFTVEPLGPGTHSWYVSITAGGNKVGYMIVHATESGGFMLGEYGAGKRPLFDMETLKLSLVRQGVITQESANSNEPSFNTEKLYQNGVLAVWRVVTADHEVWFADAATGDILPTTDKTWQAATASVSATAASLFPSSAGIRSKVYRDHYGSSFDIYAELPWLTNAAMKVKYAEQLTKPLESDTPIRYVAELYDHTATFVWGVVGYQQWSNNALYLALEEPDPEGTGLNSEHRYIGLSDLSPVGSFYR
ncbi:hypothetical protein DFQ01_13940 [Paenibacillus cellulosilyticus]|uniref:Peptidase YpeB-like protein n=1 Tax=Paenibacillus cellulosilyticus TaxID=375489 RepID=A0A2V2YNL6_9BACL|nr:hypothetical protein [Paenibacillus cellulosilyticus]PWV90988.1 hypothetical protein DFQ01_13940 [Paenibacillus cellulosilyticus]QKS45203.1 hypothetical protein HUB94_12855 [Paenibacillus cellulosilyticus]